MATLTGQQKKYLYQLLKPWATNFSSLIGSGGAFSVKSQLEKWYADNVVNPGYLQYQLGYGQQTFPITITIPNYPYLNLRKNEYSSMNRVIKDKPGLYKSSGDQAADKAAIVTYLTSLRDLFAQQISMFAGVYQINDPGKAQSAINSLNAILALINNSLNSYINGPGPSL